MVSRESFNLNPKLPTILVCSDFPGSHTGLARVTRTVFNYLADTGKYNIVQLGWFAHGQNKEQIKYPVVPTQVLANGVPDPKDQYGQLSFDDLCRVLKPDIVWCCADPWMLNHYTSSSLRGRYNLVGYVAIDSAPVHNISRDVLQKFDVIVPYCEWGKMAMEAENINCCSAPILHGVDTSVFKPLDKEERDRGRQIMGVLPDEFLFCTVGRNITRKYLPAIFPTLYYLRTGNYVFCNKCHRITLFPYDVIHRKVETKVSACKLCLSEDVVQGIERTNVRWYYHGAVSDMGWDLPDLMHQYRVQKPLILNPKLQIGVGMPDNELNQMYNSCDAFVLPTMAEGFGLPILEAMAVGLPCIITDTSAYKEWAHPAALFIESGYAYTEPKINLQRHLPSIESMVSQCLWVLDSEETRRELSQNGLKVAQSMDWKEILPQWLELMDSIVSRGKSLPWTRVQAV